MSHIQGHWSEFCLSIFTTRMFLFGREPLGKTKKTIGELFVPGHDTLGQRDYEM